MRKIFLILVSLFVAMAFWAARIHLTSGSVVEGKITETAADSLKIDVSGVPVYYKDEIAQIDGDDATAKALGVPAGSAVAAPSVETPVAQEATPQPAASAVTRRKKDRILKFIDVFGTREAMITNFSQLLSSLPADQAEELRGIFNVDTIIEELIPIYDGHFSEAELNAFINFYSSPEGKKLVTTIPQIMKESVDVSAKYFEANIHEELKNLPAPDAK